MILNDTLSLAQVHDLLTVLLRNIRAGGGIEDGTYSLEEVAERCNVSLISLIRDCRADRLRHVRKGKRMSMTPTQVAEMLEKYTQGGDTPERPGDHLDPMRQAIRASRRNATRSAPRRAA